MAKTEELAAQVASPPLRKTEKMKNTLRQKNAQVARWLGMLGPRPRGTSNESVFSGDDCASTQNSRDRNSSLGLTSEPSSDDLFRKTAKSLPDASMSSPPSITTKTPDLRKASFVGVKPGAESLPSWSTGNVLKTKLPPGERFELLIDPIPPSDRTSLVGLSQTWKNMRAMIPENEPRMQILYGSLEYLVRFVLGSCGGSYWDAFLNGYTQFATTSEVLLIVNEFLRGENPCDKVKVCTSDENEDSSTNDNAPKEPSNCVQGDSNLIPSETNASSSETDAPADAAQGSEQRKDSASVEKDEATLKSSCEEPGAEVPRRELFMLPSDDGMLSLVSRPAVDIAATSGKPKATQVTHVLHSLGLDADATMLAENAHVFLNYWLEEGFGYSSFTPDDWLLVRTMVNEAEALRGDQDELLGVSVDQLDTQSEPDTTVRHTGRRALDETDMDEDFEPALPTQYTRSKSIAGLTVVPDTATIQEDGYQSTTGSEFPVESNGSDASLPSLAPLAPLTLPQLNPALIAASTASPCTMTAASPRSERRRTLGPIRKSSFSLRTRARSFSQSWKRKSKTPLSVDSDDQTESSLAMFRPAQVAQCLTWMLFNDSYRHIQARDLVGKDSRDRSQAVQRMIDVFDTYAWWLLTWVLNRHIDQHERVERIVFWIDVAKECRRLCNFHTFFGLIAGLSQPCISWIWELVKKDDRARFEILKRAVRDKGDYLVYRADLSKCNNKSHIPFLGLTTKALFPLENHIPFVSPTQTHLVNFSRCVSVQHTLYDFLQGQVCGYETDYQQMPLSPTGSVCAFQPENDQSRCSASASHSSFASPQTMKPRKSITLSVSSVGSATADTFLSAKTNAPPAIPYLSCTTTSARGRGNSFSSGNSLGLGQALIPTRLKVDGELVKLIEQTMLQALSKDELESLSLKMRAQHTVVLVHAVEATGFF